MKRLDGIILAILIFLGIGGTCLKADERSEGIEIDRTDYNPSGEIIDEEEVDANRFKGTTPSRKATGSKKFHKRKTNRSNRGAGKKTASCC